MTPGMDERNQALGRAIDRLPVPEHHAAFWDTLRVEMTAAAPGPEPAGTASAEADDVDVIALPERRRRLRQPLLLAGAAAAIIAVVAVAFAVRAGDGTNDNVETVTTSPTEPVTAAPTEGPTEGPTQAPTPTTAPTTPTTPGVFSLAPLEPVDLGSGQVVGLSPDARFAYLTDVDPEVAALGCEGVPWESLYVQAVGASERVRIGAAQEIGASGLAEVVTGPEGRLAILTSCEEFADGLWVGTIGADGVPADLARLPLELTFVNDLEWTTDGRALLVAGGILASDGSDVRGAYRLDPATGELADLGVGPAVALAQGGFGMAVALTTGDIVLEGETVASFPPDQTGQLPVSDLAIDGDGSIWVSLFTGGVQRIVPRGDSVAFDTRPAQQLVNHPSGMLWVVTGEFQGDDWHLRTIAGELVDVVSSPDLFPVLASSGAAVAYPVFAADGSVTSTLVPFTPA